VTLETTQNESNFNFPVETQELFTADGKRVPNKAVVRTDTNKVLSVVSQNYKLVHHSELFHMAEEYMKTIGPCNVKYHQMSNGARLMAEYTFKDIAADVKKNDVVGLRTFFINSYDGKSSIRLGVAGIRLACLNGMVVSGATNEASYRHMGDHIQDGRLVNIDFPEAKHVLGAFQRGAKHWEHLSRIELSPEQIKHWQDMAIQEGIITPLIEKHDDIEEFTAWGLYNKFTEQITHRERATASAQGKIQRFNKVANWFEDVFTNA
jgi:hypothetical protein